MATRAPLLFFLSASFFNVLHATDEAEASVAALRLQEISKKVENRGDHTATYVRIRPPVLPKAPLPPMPRPPTAEEQARADELAEKAYVSLSLAGVVYLDGKRAISELRWRDQQMPEVEYRVYSNADFRFLTQLDHLETANAVYSWFPFIDEIDLKEWPKDQPSPLPRGIKFSTTEIEYYLDKRSRSAAGQESVLEGLDYLHAYYQLHYAKLKAAYEHRIAEQAKVERELRENPPRKPNTILYWWPVKDTRRIR